MNIIGCLDRPTAGRYFLDGEDVSSLSRDDLADVRNRKLGFVFQNFNLLARTSALENVELPLLYSDVALTSAQLREKAEHVLAAVGLEGRGDHTPSQLSGGQQQRVAIARALINDPEVLLADEPTGNLDSIRAHELLGLLRDMVDHDALTILMVTHDQELANSFADRIVFMKDGRIV
jgi:putative ABC transport system ATP-binding protein